MHHHGHHGGGWWGRNFPNYIPLAYTDRTNYAPLEVIQQPTIPDWALYTGLGLLALIALGGHR